MGERDERVGREQAMRNIARLFRNRNFIMLLALFAGLVMPWPAHYMQGLVLPALAMIMTISTMGITGASITSLRRAGFSGLAGTCATFLIQGAALLALNSLFIRNHDTWTGFVILAAVPPAVAVIPFSLFLGGNMAFSLMGTIGAYIAALVITPMIALMFLGSGFINPVKLLIILGELILGPLVLSRILLATGLSAKLESVKGPLTNWSFFLVVYIMVALNRQSFVEQPFSLIPIVLISLGTTFILGSIIERTGILLKVERSVITSLLLLGTFKNYGLAGGLSLYFFNEQTALPSTVASVVSILYFIWLEARRERTAAP